MCWEYICIVSFLSGVWYRIGNEYNNKISIFRRAPGHSKLKFNRVKRSLGRLKNKEYPKRPKTLQQVQNAFENPDLFEFCETLDKSGRIHVVTVITDEYSFCLFASFKTIDFIKENIDQRYYLMDGTFKIVPSQFYQLLIISIEFKNDVCVDEINLNYESIL